MSLRFENTQKNYKELTPCPCRLSLSQVIQPWYMPKYPRQYTQGKLPKAKLDWLRGKVFRSLFGRRCSQKKSACGLGGASARVLQGADDFVGDTSLKIFTSVFAFVWKNQLWSHVKTVIVQRSYCVSQKSTIFFKSNWILKFVFSKIVFIPSLPNIFQESNELRFRNTHTHTEIFWFPWFGFGFEFLFTKVKSQEASQTLTH